MLNPVMMKAYLRRIYKIFFDAVFPSRCMICRVFFHHDRFVDSAGIEQTEPATLSFDNVMGRFLCRSCLLDFSEVGSPKCSVCGFMFKSRAGEDHVCGKCIGNPGRFRKARAYGLYDRSLRESIHRFKYHGKTYLADPLGFLLFSTFIRDWDPDDIDIIIPIPLHQGRLRRRGFNQTYQLIRKWPEWWENKKADPFPALIDQGMLFRKKNTGAQVGLGRKERIANIKGVFEVKNHSKIKGKNILLIDDVLTTGATANECVKVLLKNGAETVDVLTLAHTERHIL